MYQLKSVAVLLAAVAMGWTQPSVAQSAADADSLALKLANAVSPDRFFIRAGVIGVKIKTKSGDAYDVTGPLVTFQEFKEMMDPNKNVIRDAMRANGVTTDENNDQGYTDAAGVQQRLRSDTGGGIPTILAVMDQRDLTALGSPLGIKAIAKESMGTAGLSLGMFLDDEYKWAVEAYVLAVPPQTSVNIAGPSLRRSAANGGIEEVMQPFPLAGQKIITTKLLPPVVTLGRYWGNKDSRFRPYTGVIGMYGIFYDTKATDALNYFVGGQNPGDTTVSFKNTFGMGPMLGGKFQLNDKWHVNLNIGHVKLKTVGTLVTRNTLLTSKTTGVLAYGDDPSKSYGTNPSKPWGLGSVTSALLVAENTLWKEFSFDPAGDVKFDSVRSIVSRVVAYQRYLVAGGDPTKAPADQGTFVRKSEATLSNTLFMLSVGRSF